MESILTYSFSIAGRNCVVVADFGLTGYGKKTADDDFHHNAEDDKQHNKVIAAFKKLRPNSDQRLHITTLTDPMDIRKWTKAHYDEHSFQSSHSLKKLTQLTKMIGDQVKKQQKEMQKRQQQQQQQQEATSENGEDPDQQQSLPQSAEPSENSQHSEDSSQRRRIMSEEYAAKRQEEHPLPKADPKDIVLSRANFLLEFGQDKLPPYHVFYSNSECIAVWCKTGRWSTLQTAVFLSSNAIGGAKSATVATLGVAAAHALLAPVVAVGGLLWVTAPMVILKKSREKWEENTHYMTDLYWQSWAPPSVYVCAIEHWSELGYQSAADRDRPRILTNSEYALKNNNSNKSEEEEQKGDNELSTSGNGQNGGEQVRIRVGVDSPKSSTATPSPRSPTQYGSGVSTGSGRRRLSSDNGVVPASPKTSPSATTVPPSSPLKKKLSNIMASLSSEDCKK